MSLPNSDIPGLYNIATLPNGGLVALWDPITAATYNFDLSTIAQPQGNVDYRWIPSFAYSAGDIVTYQGQLWQSQINANTGNIPASSSVDWTLISKSPSGLVLWQAGAFTEANVYVLYVLDGFTQLFRLASAARPFSSTNFLAEFAAGSWELTSERGYMPINKAAHGWAQYTVLTFDSGTWQAVNDATDTRLAIVMDVISTGAVNVKLLGERVRGFSGLTPGSKYYSQNDGTISATLSSNIILYAISATEAIVLQTAGSMPSGGGGAAGRLVFRFDSNLFTEDDLSFRGAVTFTGSTLTANIASFTFMARIDTGTYAPFATLAALQTWINANVSGSNLTGTIFWIKVIATYTSGVTGTAEVALTY